MLKITDLKINNPNFSQSETAKEMKFSVQRLRDKERFETLKAIMTATVLERDKTHK